MGLSDYFGAFSQRVQVYIEALPILVEIIVVVGAAFVIKILTQAYLYHAENVKHSLYLKLQGDPLYHEHATTNGREHPREHNAYRFFQNKQGMWIHYNMWTSNVLLQQKLKKHAFGDQHAISGNQLKDVKGVIFLLHGHSEHINRHAHVADYFTDRDFVVIGMDHQGFGRSEGDRCHVENFEDYVDDVILLMKNTLMVKFPELNSFPRFIMGHSMGSLITIRTALRLQTLQDESLKLTGIITGAAALTPSKSPEWQKRILLILAYLFPKSQLFSFPSAPSTSFLQSKLHSKHDPLNYAEALRPHQALEMFKAIDRTQIEAEVFNTPIMMFHGTEDGTVHISGAKSFFEKIKSPKKYFLELPGKKHEPLQNEWKEREPILEEVYRWIKDQL